MAINRLRVLWGGTNIAGPGVTTFYFSGTMVGKPAAVVTLFTSLAGMVPPGGTFTIPSSGDVIDESTGVLTGGWTATGGGLVNSSGTGAWLAGAGAVVDLQTGAVFLGRRVRGRFFVVPVTTAQADTSGTIANATVTSQNTALATFLAAVTPDWKIWSRPRPGGQYATSQVTAATLADRATQLRSRRV